MAAPFAINRSLFSLGKQAKSFNKFQHARPFHLPQPIQYSRNYSSGSKSSWNFNIRPTKSGFRVAALVLGGGFVLRKIFNEWNGLKVYAEGKEGRPVIEPSRQVVVDTDTSGLKLTLYQYQTCPFCCKTRAYLDYQGFSYDVVEVNSVTKKQLKWSDYKKVPILIAEGAGIKEEIPLHDSTQIISILESFLHDRSTSLKTFHSYYPVDVEGQGKKKKFSFPNRYFVMFQDKADLGTTPKQRNEERKWRRWADDHMVHMLSPNAYRTMREALQSFNYFSQVGEWEKNFSFVERMMVIYLGALVMYIMSFIIKRRYDLKDDVRESLYDACNEWIKAIGKHRPFMGGDEPNLADLAVYGVLNSIEGCQAFHDATFHTDIGPWYKRTKEAIASHKGSLAEKPENITVGK